MREPDWKKLARILSARGMNPARVDRVVGELADHAGDLREELEGRGMAPDRARAAALEKMGDAETLADEILQGYARRTLWGRHPLAGSLLLPFLSVILLMAAWMPVGNLIFPPLFKALRAHGEAVDFAFIRSFFLALFGFTEYTLTAMAAWLLLRAAKKRVLETKWAFLATSVTALLGYLLFPALKVLPPVVEGRLVSGTFTVGLGLGLSCPPADHFARLLLPFVLFAAIYAENLRSRFRQTAP